MTVATSETTRVIYRCKNCKHIWAYEYETQGKHLFRMVDGKKVFYGDDLNGRCINCRSLNFEGNRVEGKVTAHVCNAKCMSATNGTCECSCGGKNHGISHM